MNLHALNDRVSNSLGVVDPTAILVEQLKNSLKNMSPENALEVLKGLPQSTIEQICKEGVKDKVSGYIPVAVGAVAGGAVGYMVTDGDLLKVAGFAAVAGLGAYLLFPPSSN